MRMLRPEVVSVILVNYGGADDTLDALDALSKLDYPADRIETIVVDNASGPDEVACIRAAHPAIKLVELSTNVGFAAGCNAGVNVATGQYLAFLNNDAKPEAKWLTAAVQVLTDDGVACVASKILDWEGHTVDFVDAAMSFYGHGFKLHAGESDDPIYDRPHDVLFASGAAMVIDAEVYRDAGGFDDRYFMFFEDVDLGWRLWLQGYRVRYVPDSLVFHRHHATIERYGKWREDYLLERNALYTIFKNYDDEHLRSVLPAALMLATRRAFVRGGVDSSALDLATNLDAGDADRLEVSKQGLTGPFAIDSFTRELKTLTADRRRVQARRRRPDHEITRLFKLAIFANIDHPDFVQPFDAVVDSFGISGTFSPRRRILIATGDVLQARMAGPAIRAWQIAKALSEEHEVTLVTTMYCALTHPDFAIQHVEDRDLTRLVAKSDIVILQGNLMAQHSALEQTDRVVVADIYDPFHLEVLEQARGLEARDRRFATQSSKEVLNQQLIRGDYFLCASDKQRDFWLGQLAGVGRINPATYDEEENLKSLIAVVPFGVDDTPPQAERPVLKGVVPGIGADDPVILWGGGIYNWFDPLTLLRAVDKLRRRVPNVRLFFLGLKHPNPHVGEMRMAVDTRDLADELGLTDTHVFFNEGWVAYHDRQNYLLEADIGVSTHLDHVETAFSFRTRILDYFWAGLPVVATAGDSLAELIQVRGAGITVASSDVDALEDALFRLLDDDAQRLRCEKASRLLAEELQWSRVLQPLLAFCRAPRRAPDLIDPLMAATVSDPLRTRLVRRRLQRDLGILSEHLREGDFRTLASRMWSRIRGMAGRR